MTFYLGANIYYFCETEKRKNEGTEKRGNEGTEKRGTEKRGNEGTINHRITMYHHRITIEPQ
jgi:hypothetical protein